MVTRRFNDGLRRETEQVIGLPIGEPTAAAYAVTGEPYVTLVAGGIKPEGEDYPNHYFTRSTAVARYSDSVYEYAAARSGALYWRQYPMIIHEDDWWQVNSRLLISAKPDQLLSQPNAELTHGY